MLIRHRTGIRVTIQHVRKNILKFQRTGNYKDHKRAGMANNFYLRSKRIIRRICLKNSRLSLTNIAGSYKTMSEDRMSKSTVNRIFLKYGLRSSRYVNKPFLTDRQQKKKMNWARKRKEWPREDWYQVVFRDKCMFRTLNNCERDTIRRFDYERFSPICTNKTV